MISYKHFLASTLLVIPSFVCTSVSAQSTPSEFADLSLAELFQIKVDESAGQSEDEHKWALTYQFRSIEFDGYKDGNSRLDLDEVLWNGPSETRTNKNFPVVPTVIRQHAHLVGLGYDYSEQVSFSLSVPLIKQSTDHISIIPGYDQFMIDTSGIGDVVFSTRYQFINTQKHNWWFSIGLSLPTGSIDEQGDTPRAPGDQQLPYTMQLGSGTYDIPMEFSYHREDIEDFSLSFSAMLRTGKNDRDYRLGNSYRISGKYFLNLTSAVKVSLGGEAQYIERIHGQDDELLVPAPVPYPASITNPGLYGGKKLVVEAGLNWQLSETFQISLEIGKPVYQNLNGPQPGETWRSSIQLATRL